MRKGYTLVELLAVIVIIAIIAILALANISKKSNELRVLSNDQVEKLIKSSARSYFYNNNAFRQEVKNTGKGTITYKTLKDNNYLSNNLKNLTTYKDIDIDSSCICVKYENYEYTFNIKQPCNCN